MMGRRPLDWRRLLLGLSIWLGLVLATLLLLCVSARAEASYQSFGATNYIGSSATITSWPTNSAGTNGLNRLTGGLVSVANNEHVSFLYRGEPVPSNTTNTLTFTFVRAFVPSPTMASNSVAGNGTFAAFAGIETLPTLTIAVNLNGTNATTWGTNIDAYCQGGVAAIGVYTMVNGFSAAVTNFDIGISKKIVPIVYK